MCIEILGYFCSVKRSVLGKNGLFTTLIWKGKNIPKLCKHTFTNLILKHSTIVFEVRKYFYIFNR